METALQIKGMLKNQDPSLSCSDNAADDASGGTSIHNRLSPPTTTHYRCLSATSLPDRITSLESGARPTAVIGKMLDGEDARACSC